MSSNLIRAIQFWEVMTDKFMRQYAKYGWYFVLSFWPRLLATQLQCKDLDVYWFACVCVLSLMRYMITVLYCLKVAYYINYLEIHHFFLFSINRFRVESAPAIVIFRDAGVEPFVYHGNLLSPSVFSVLYSIY